MHAIIQLTSQFKSRQKMRFMMQLVEFIFLFSANQIKKKENNYTHHLIM